MSGNTKTASVEWNSSYSVGIREMDEQHIALFASFNDFCAAIEEERSSSETEPLLRKLLAITQQHFRSEEALLAGAAFPQLAHHGNHHRDLNTLMNEYLVRFDRGELGSSANLLSFLREWLIHHIETEDK